MTHGVLSGETGLMKGKSFFFFKPRSLFFFQAALRGHLQIVQHLVAHGADVHVQDNS